MSHPPKQNKEGSVSHDVGVHFSRCPNSGFIHVMLLLLLWSILSEDVLPLALILILWNQVTCMQVMAG